MPHSGTLINFPGQESDEQIFIYIRRYPVAFLPAAVLTLLVTGLGLAVIALLGIGTLFSQSELILIGSAFLLFMMLFGLIEFIDFYFDLHIVTDRRLVDIDQHRLFNRTVSELLLDDIQDVKAKSKGILATFFDFGDVMIQTAGTQANFEFTDVHHPNEVAAIIIDLSDQTQRGVPIADRHPEGPIAAIINDVMLPHTADHENELPTWKRGLAPFSGENGELANYRFKRGQAPSEPVTTLLLRLDTSP